MRRNFLVAAFAALKVLALSAVAQPEQSEARDKVCPPTVAYGSQNATAEASQYTLNHWLLV